MKICVLLPGLTPSVHYKHKEDAYGSVVCTDGNEHEECDLYKVPLIISMEREDQISWKNPWNLVALLHDRCKYQGVREISSSTLNTDSVTVG